MLNSLLTGDIFLPRDNMILSNMIVDLLCYCSLVLNLKSSICAKGQ